MIGTTTVFSQAATDCRGLKLRVGTEICTVGLESTLLLAHSLLTARKYTLAGRICEAVFRCGSNAPQAAILLACCKAGLHDYAVCNRILEAVSVEGSDHLAEQVEAALSCTDRRMSAADSDTLIGNEDANWACKRDAGQESDLGGQSLFDVVVALGLSSEGTVSVRKEIRG